MVRRAGSLDRAASRPGLHYRMIKSLDQEAEEIRTQCHRQRYQISNGRVQSTDDEAKSMIQEVLEGPDAPFSREGIPRNSGVGGI